MTKKIIGTVIDGKYNVLSLLGEGGNGSVYKAYQPDLTRFVAIKIMHAADARDSDRRLRFEREIAILARLAHENIVKTYSVGFLDDCSLYLVLDYLEGKSLDRLLQEKSTIEEPRLLRIGVQLCKAVEYAHSQGIIHRDLKPQNIMVLDCPDAESIKVLDFGLSKVVYPDSQEVQKLTRTGSLIGSVNYMSPEMCGGKHADFRSDIYSLGCVLYECAVGVPPFQADNPLSVMYKHRQEYPSLLKKATLSDLELVVFKCLQKDPVDRFQSAGALCRALELIMDGRSEELRLGKLHQGTIGSASKNKAGQIWLLLLFLSLLCGLVFMLTKQHLSQEHVQDKRKPALTAATERKLESELKGSLARAERNFGPDSLETKEKLARLGEYYMKQKRYAEAEPLLKRALAIDEKELGPKNSLLFWRLVYLADCLENQNRFAEASPLYERALAVRTMVIGTMDPKSVVERTLAIGEKGAEAMDPQRDVVLAVLADCYSKQKRFPEAEATLERALAVKEKVLGSDHPDIARGLCTLAGWYKAQGKYAEAEALYKRSMDIWDKALEPAPRDVAMGLKRYAELLRNLNRNTEADRLEKRAKALQGL